MIIKEGKNLNFQLKNQNFKDKIIYIVLDKSFPENGDSWRNQALQREFILEKLNYIDSEDCIMFSDPDEIPNPKILANLKLEKNMVFFFSKCIVINSIFIINMKVLGKVPESVKKKS